MGWLTTSEALDSIRDTTLRILRHPSNGGRRGRALILYVAWQVWERVVRRPWTIRLGTTRRIRLYPHSTIPALVLYCRVPDYEEMSFVRHYLRAGDLFVDVGANVGLYSLWASESPDVDVLAFEPSTVTYGRALENVDLNGLSERVEVRRRALAEVDAAVRLTIGLDAVNRVVGADRNASAANTEVVAQSTLDAELDDRVPALIKIDVEGAELDVLRGGRSVILRSRPALLVEVNDPPGLAALLGELGYRTWRYDPETRALRPALPVLGTNVLALADLERAEFRLQRAGSCLGT